MTALFAFRKLFLRQSRGMLLALCLSIVALGAGVALLGTSGWFISAAALTGAGLAFNLFAPSALVRGFSFIRILARYGERLAGHDATLRLLSDLRGWLFSRLFPRLPLTDRSLRHGDLVSRFTADIDALDTAFLVAIGPIVAALAIGLALTAVLAWLLPGAALVYGLCYGLAIIAVPGGLVLASRSSGAALVGRAAAARATVLDGIDGHLDLAAFGVLGLAQQRFEQIIGRLSLARLQLFTQVAVAGFAVQSLAGLAFVGSLWLGLGAYADGAIDGPVLAGLLLGIAGSFEGSSVLVRSVGKLSTAIAAAQRLAALADTPVTAVDPIAPVAWPADPTIAMIDIGFTYGGAPVLANLDLVVAAGSHIAITGPSGSGKSTLLMLLLRLSEPQVGQVTVGGVPLAALREADVHSHIALLGQDSAVFNDTIRANLLIGRDDADTASLWHSLAAVGLDDFVRASPAGLETLVGEGGRTISVGQARRLCLARVLLSNAEILLLDEPTSGLDRAAEEAFFATLRTAAQGRTIVLVTHADLPEGTVERTLVLEHGRLC